MLAIPAPQGTTALNDTHNLFRGDKRALVLGLLGSRKTLEREEAAIAPEEINDSEIILGLSHVLPIHLKKNEEFERLVACILHDVVHNLCQ